MQKRRNFLRSLAGVLGRWPWLFVGLGLAGALLAGLYTARNLQFKTSRNDLIGRDSEYWRLYSEYAREFRAEEDYILLVESDQPARNREVVDALVQALVATSNNPHPADAASAQQFGLPDLYYRVDLAELQDWFLYYLSVPELQQIGAAVKEFRQLVAILQHRPKLDTFLDAMRRMLMVMANASPAERQQMGEFLPTITAIVNQLGSSATNAAGNELLTPWATAFFSEEMIGEAEQQMQWQGYQAFDGGRIFVVLVHPRGGALDGETAPHEATIPKIRRIVEQVQAQHPQARINLTGEPVLDHDEMLASQRDATRATLLTLAVIAVLFALSFREVLRPILAVFCMVLVLGLSLGWATLAVGHLNIITVTFAVMLLGLGIDLGIQMVARFEEELSGGADRLSAIRATIEHTGPSILTAGLTNAAAFFAMMLSGFKGVSELGLIAGGGLLIATLVTMLVLPSLLLVVRRRSESREIPAQRAAHRFDQFMLRRPVLVLAGCGVLTLVALLVGWQVRFDYNVLNLQSKGLPSVEAELRLLRSPDAESSIYAAVVVDSLEQARRVHHSLTGLASVATVHSIAELIPENQQQKAPLVAAIQEHVQGVRFEVPAADPADVEAVQRSLGGLRLRVSQLQRQLADPTDQSLARRLEALATAIRDARQRLESLGETERFQRLAAYEQRFYRDLETQLRLLATQKTDQPMTLAEVPPTVKRMLVGASGKFLIRVFPRENIWDRGPLERFVREVQSVAPQATGTPLGLYEFVAILQQGYIKAALWALLVIAIIIALDFRSLAATALTLVPLLVGMAWTFGVLALFGISFNPANIMVLPLTVGIGVAYGIYIVQRFREDRNASLYGKSTGRAVLLSAATTVVGFSSLMIGNHRGIFSLGLVMAISISACLLASLVLLPALLEMARRRQWRL